MRDPKELTQMYEPLTCSYPLDICRGCHQTAEDGTQLDPDNYFDGKDYGPSEAAVVASQARITAGLDAIDGFVLTVRGSWEPCFSSPEGKGKTLTCACCAQKTEQVYRVVVLKK